MGPRTKSTSTLAATLHTADLKTFLQQLQQTEEEMSGSHTEAWPVRFSSKVCEKRKHQSRAGTPLDPRTQARVSAAIKFTISYSRLYVELSNTASSTVNPNHLIQIYVNVSPPPPFFLLPFSSPHSGRQIVRCKWTFQRTKAIAKKNFSNFFFLFIFHAVKRQKKDSKKENSTHTKTKNCMNERTRKRNKSVNEHENACALRVRLFLLASKHPSELQSLNASHIHMWNYIFPFSSLISPSSLFSLPAIRLIQRHHPLAWKVPLAGSLKQRVRVPLWDNDGWGGGEPGEQEHIAY